MRFLASKAQYHIVTNLMIKKYLIFKGVSNSQWVSWHFVTSMPAETSTLVVVSLSIITSIQKPVLKLQDSQIRASVLSNNDGLNIHSDSILSRYGKKKNVFGATWGKIVIEIDYKRVLDSSWGLWWYHYTNFIEVSTGILFQDSRDLIECTVLII